MLRTLLTQLLILIAFTSTAVAQGRNPLPEYVLDEYGTPPATPVGPLSETANTALDDILAIATAQSDWLADDTAAFTRLADQADPRIGWIIADMQRFSWRQEFYKELTKVSEAILTKTFDSGRPRNAALDTLIAWDIPTYPSYLDDKRRIYTRYNDGWDDLFVKGDIDWHLVDWGGVDIDARPYDQTDEICNCIPAIDNPEVSTADAATWLKDENIVFGVVINGQARAYPRQIMEVREMVNDTLGGREIGLPYCSLCGAAQAYFTDRMPAGVKRPVLRTSGLLIRSNKVMYDIETLSLFDTFLGKAVTGPLAQIDLKLDPVTVITSDWGTWRATYPDTTVLVEALALGRDYNLRETRDARGPIFPIGDVDPRLPVHEDIIGVIAADGTPIAFPRTTAIAALRSGQGVAFKDVELVLSAGGLRAIGLDQQDLPSHEAFWFAWSQFHSNTDLWSG